MSQRSIFSSEEEDDGDSTLSSDEELSIYTYGEKQTRDAEEFKGEQRETSGFGLPLMRNLFAKIVPAEKMIQAKERAEVHPEGHIPESKAPCVTEKEKLLLNFSKVVDGLLIQNPPPQQPSQPLTEENILASELCSAIEEIFLYGLKCM